MVTWMVGFSLDVGNRSCWMLLIVGCCDPNKGVFFLCDLKTVVKVK